MTVTILTAGSHQGDSLAALLIPAVRRPGVAMHARNDTAANALVTAAADAGGGVAVQLAKAARASTVAIASRTIAPISPSGY